MLIMSSMRPASSPEHKEKITISNSVPFFGQISAYVDNEFDVAGLMEEAETRQAALDQVAELEEELARVAERLAETEMEAMSQQVSIFNLTFLILWKRN
jgi:pyruvate-formate lyase